MQFRHNTVLEQDGTGKAGWRKWRRTSTLAIMNSNRIIPVIIQTAILRSVGVHAFNPFFTGQEM